MKPFLKLKPKVILSVLVIKLRRSISRLPDIAQKCICIKNEAMDISFLLEPLSKIQKNVNNPRSSRGSDIEPNMARQSFHHSSRRLQSLQECWTGRIESESQTESFSDKIWANFWGVIGATWNWPLDKIDDVKPGWQPQANQRTLCVHGRGGKIKSSRWIVLRNEVNIGQWSRYWSWAQRPNFKKPKWSYHWKIFQDIQFQHQIKV